MKATVTTIAPELVACIAEAREPTVVELSRMADRVGIELFGPPLLFALDRDPTGSRRPMALRVALMALTGDVAAVALRDASGPERPAA